MALSILTFLTIVFCCSRATTTSEEWSCEVKIPIFCPENQMMFGIMAELPFFGKGAIAMCGNKEEKIYEGDADVLRIRSENDGKTLSAECPDIKQIMSKFTLCVKGKHVAGVEMHCHYPKKGYKIGQRSNVTSEDPHTIVKCEPTSTWQSIYLEQMNEGLCHRVVVGCAPIEKDPAADAGGGGGGKGNKKEEKKEEKEEAAKDDRWQCEIEVPFLCPRENAVLNGLGSRSPFCSDAMISSFIDMRMPVCEGKGENHKFYAGDDGWKIEAKCPKDHQVIQNVTMCLKDGRVKGLKVYCKNLKEKYWNGDSCEVSSDKNLHALVKCEDESAVESIRIENSGDDIITQITFGCKSLKT